MPGVHRRRQRRHVPLALFTRRNYRRWGEREQRRLLWLADQHRNDAARLQRLAAALGRSPVAVRIRLRQLGWTRGFTLRAVANLLNIREGCLLELLRADHFIPGLAYHGRPVRYDILEDDLWAWLEDVRSWHIWRPEKIADPAVRAHFTELRRDWLTTRQVADILHVSRASVSRYYCSGYLPGRKGCARAVWFHRADVNAFRSRLSGGCYILVDPVALKTRRAIARIAAAASTSAGGAPVTGGPA